MPNKKNYFWTIKVLILKKLKELEVVLLMIYDELKSIRLGMLSILHKLEMFI